MTSIADRYRATENAARSGTLVIGPLAGALIVCAMAAVVGFVAADRGLVIIAEAQEGSPKWVGAHECALAGVRRRLRDQVGE